MLTWACSQDFEEQPVKEHRHCERSEAIQSLAAATVWIASALRASQ
jgi:hypothetical protein